MKSRASCVIETAKRGDAVVYALSPKNAGSASFLRDLADQTGGSALEVDSLMLLSENSNFDFGSKPLDEPFTDAELARFTGTQSHRDRVLAALGGRKPTPRDFITITRRGKLPPPWVGGPKEVADIFEEWFSAPACDGFVVGAACVPGSYEDFVNLVVPELQRRGRFRSAYTGRTLRENLAG